MIIELEFLWGGLVPHRLSNIGDNLFFRGEITGIVGGENIFFPIYFGNYFQKPMIMVFVHALILICLDQTILPK